MIRSNRALSRHHLWLVALQIVGGCSLLSSHHLCDKIVLGFFFFFFSCVPLRPMGCCFFFSLGGMIVREIGQKINKLLMVGFFEYIYIYISGFRDLNWVWLKTSPLKSGYWIPATKGYSIVNSSILLTKFDSNGARQPARTKCVRVKRFISRPAVDIRTLPLGAQKWMEG